MSAARIVLASLVVLVAGCGRQNVVADSELRDPDQFWTIGGQARVYRDLGPGGSALVYVPGDGKPSGFISGATFLAAVQPGQTYTLSAYLDATGLIGTPPVVALEAANGSWAGASMYQTGKGVVTTTFSIPADSGTTLIRGIFSTENGTYPVGRGAAFSEPQIGQGSVAHAYVPGNGGPLAQAPASGNLIAGSDLRAGTDYWELTGRMRLAQRSAQNGAGFAEYAGDGKPSGYGDAAKFVAAVAPDTTYTFSIFIDASAAVEGSPYVFLQPLNGTWRGIAMTQAERGLLFITFAIPRSTRTTMIRIVASPQDAVFPRGARFVVGLPQLCAADIPKAYVPGGGSSLPAPIGGNAVIDSGLRSPSTAWRLTGAVRAENGEAVYDGTGRPSGYSNTAEFFAKVSPGQTYTFSAFVDGSAHVGTQPFVFLSAVDGSWHGTQLDQPGAGRVYTSFTIPVGSGTTCIEGSATPQGGAYPVGSRMTFAQPEIALGAALSRYVESSAWAAVPSHAASPCG